MSFANKIIDRVIFCLTNNETYIDFWNYISKVYKEKYNTTPTLFFSGTETDLNNLISSNRLSKEYGEIYHLPRVEGVFYVDDLDWTCTWGLFYGSSLFPDDICMLSGIDQIPLNNYLFEYLDKHDYRDFYNIMWSDAYGDNFASGKVYPSSHHIAKGKYFKQLYNIEDKWEDELKKVFNSKDKITFSYLYNKNNLWGLDELYSSHIINEYLQNNLDSNVKLHKNIFTHYSMTRLNRNDLNRYNLQDLLRLVKEQKFTEFHAQRPFLLNKNMNFVYNNICGHSNILSFG